jgi:hypothetical protein
MPQVGFEPTIPVFQRAKTVHALDRAATVIGKWVTRQEIYTKKILDSTLCTSSGNMLSGSFVNKAWRVPRLRMEETAYRCER